MLLYLTFRKLGDIVLYSVILCLYRANSDAQLSETASFRGAPRTQKLKVSRPLPSPPPLPPPPPPQPQLIFQSFGSLSFFASGNGIHGSECRSLFGNSQRANSATFDGRCSWKCGERYCITVMVWQRHAPFFFFFFFFFRSFTTRRDQSQPL